MVEGGKISEETLGEKDEKKILQKYKRAFQDIQAIYDSETLSENQKLQKLFDKLLDKVFEFLRMTKSLFLLRLLLIRNLRKLKMVLKSRLSI
jgi:hypothetical protein